jgi:hypothetical protein
MKKNELILFSILFTLAGFVLTFVSTADRISLIHLFVLDILLYLIAIGSSITLVYKYKNYYYLFLTVLSFLTFVFSFFNFLTYLRFFN